MRGPDHDDAVATIVATVTTTIVAVVVVIVAFDDDDTGRRRHDHDTRRRGRCHDDRGRAGRRDDDGGPRLRDDDGRRRRRGDHDRRWRRGDHDDLGRTRTARRAAGCDHDDLDRARRGARLDEAALEARARRAPDQGYVVLRAVVAGDLHRHVARCRDHRARRAGPEHVRLDRAVGLGDHLHVLIFDEQDRATVHRVHRERRRGRRWRCCGRGRSRIRLTTAGTGQESDREGGGDRLHEAHGARRRGHERPPFAERRPTCASACAARDRAFVRRGRVNARRCRRALRQAGGRSRRRTCR